MKILASLLVTIAILFIGCSDEKQMTSKKQQTQSLPVKAETIVLQNTNFTKNYSAILKPFKEVDVIARINGLLIKENFTEGSYVKKGDKLYEIEKDEYEASLDAVKGESLKAQANYNKSLKDYTRASYLFQNKAISEQEYDERLYIYEDSKAELQRTKAALKNAQIQYDYTSIKAPISGMIGMSSSDEGSYIDAKSSKLTTITSQDFVYAEFSIPSSDIEKYMSQIKLDSEISIKVGDTQHLGKVDYIAPKLDSQTDTLLVRAKLENEKRELIIGSFVEVILSGFSYENIAKVPENALLKSPEATSVYLIKDGAVVTRHVDVVHIDKGFAYISSGVKNGDKVVISNIAKLRPDTKVSIIGSK